MGLDMYLERMPRYRYATPNDISNVESYLDYLDNCNNLKSNANQYTLKEWCGVNEEDINYEYVTFYKKFYNKKYPDWDTEHKYGWNTIMDQVAYWRKKNAIHNWFVENVQDGMDDCRYHNEVTREVLEKLHDVCHEVLTNMDLADELLPTANYDEWYFDGLKYTIDKIDDILKTTDFENEMIYYRSSW